MDRAGHLKRWDVELGLPEEVAQLASDQGEVVAADWTADGSTIATAHPQGIVQLWELSSKDPLILEPLPAVGEQPRAISQLQLSENGRVLLGLDAKQKLYLWSTETQQQQLWPQAMAPVVAAQLSAGGDRLLTQHEAGKVTLWNVETGQQIRQWTLPVTAIALNPAGDGFAVALPQGQVKLFSADSELQAIPPLEAAVEGETITSLSFGPEQLMAGTESGKLVLWNRATGRILRKLEHPAQTQWAGKAAGAIAQVSVSPEGQWVAAVTESGEVAFWAARAEALQRLARDRSFRPLTPEECWAHLQLREADCP